MPDIAITMGDPSGIGPEVVCRALLKMNPTERQDLCIVGHKDTLERANILIGGNLKFSSSSGHGVTQLIEVETPKKRTIIDCLATEGGGHAAFGFVQYGVKLAMSGTVRALVTAPINKQALHMAGHKYDGHTDILQKLTQAPSSFMLLRSKNLTTILTSTHVPLSAAILSCNKDRVIETIRAGNHHLQKIGNEKPKLAVAGLNPHSGENGIFGQEEILHIEPAITQARSEGINVSGPYPADTIFHRASQGEFDLVVAQYHDQGLIPIKLIDFENAINVTLGLPIHRTSVDHGTAFDIAWRGVAKDSSMMAAIRYAQMMANL